jgi:2-iminobutanoate/2-iminopropanoate deaminase
MTSPLLAISTPQAAQPIGHYQQAIAWQNLIYTSGQIGVDPTTNQLINSNIEDETRQALNNLQQVLLAANSSLNQVIKTTIYVTDLSQFQTINTIYSEFFSSHKPARSCVEVSKLPKGAQVEIEAIAATTPCN